MSKKILTISTLLLIAVSSICCSCKWFETMAQLQELFDEADIVFVGLPVKNINPSEVNSNKRVVGFDVLLKVLSVQKGLSNTDTVLVLQGDNNCAQRFMYGDTIVVFGYTIKEIKKVKDRHAEDYSDDKIFRVSKRDKFYNLAKHLNKIHPSVFTSQCISFPQSDSLMTAFIRARKH